MAGILSAQDTALARREFAKAVLSDLRGDQNGKSKHEEAARVAHPQAILLADRAAKRALRSGDTKTASTLYRQLANDRADSLHAQFLYTDFLRAHSADDDYAWQLAVDHLEKIKTLQPTQPEVLERLLRLYEQKGERQQSEKLYQDYLTQPNNDPAVAAMFHRILRDQDDATSREHLDRMYREKMTDTPGDERLARQASEHFRKTKRLGEAIDVLQQHVKAMPSSLDLRVRLGILQLAHHQEKEGEATLLDTLKIDPSLFLAHQSLAKLYDQQNKADLARKHRTEMLKLRGGDVSEFREVAEDLLRAKEAKAARILLEKACFDFPKDADLAYLHAVATHLDAEQAEKAAERFDLAQQLAQTPTTNPLYLRHASEAYWGAKQTEKAESLLRAAIKAYSAKEKKESAAAMRLLASWWKQQDKNPDAANALLQRAEMLEK